MNNNRIFCFPQVFSSLIFLSFVLISSSQFSLQVAQSPGCKSQAQNVCLQCYDDFDNIQGTCICSNAPIFYTKNQTNCQNCSVPIPYCVSCKISTFCDICLQNSHRQFSINGKCQCLKGFYQANQPVCHTCSIMAGCVSCTNSQICLQCDQNLRRYVNKTTHKCECVERYYENNQNLCQQCSMSNCLRCNQENCLKCDSKVHRIQQNGLCKCQIKFFQNQNLQCQACILGCLTCKNNQTCTVCDKENHFKIQSSSHKNCVCEDGFYLDTEQKICLLCSQTLQNCVKCSNQAVCLQCTSDYQIINEKCQKIDRMWMIYAACGAAFVLVIIIGIIIYIKKKKSKARKQEKNNKKNTLIDSLTSGTDINQNLIQASLIIQ